MPLCVICLQQRSSLKFATGRISICAFCVTTLNNTDISPRLAEQAMRQALVENTLRTHGPDAHEWVYGWVPKVFDDWLAKRLAAPHHVRASPALKVIRAYRRNLVCLDRRRLDYPTEQRWNFKRYRIKHGQDYICHLCHARVMPWCFTCTTSSSAAAAALTAPLT